MIYVIGSGPSGVTAASALLDEGQAVTLLDVGHTCEPSQIDLARRVAATPRDKWSPNDIAELRGPSYFADPDQPLKRVFGSSFPYAIDELRGDRQLGSRCTQSFARGGLSNVWGAAVLPARAADLIDWPIGLTDLAPGYAAVARWLPIAAAADDLEAAFPFYAPPQAPLRPSRQAARLASRLADHRDRLATTGIRGGLSRLAVRSEPSGASGTCHYTGLCLTGCPHFAIWSADDRLRALQRRPGFSYRSGMRVDELAPAPTGLTEIRSTHIANGDVETVQAARVLLACGPLATARIVLKSLAAYDRVIALRYQPYFLLPLLVAQGVDDVESESLHTLAQLFLELDDPEVSPHTVHLQVYTYNHFVDERLQRMLRALGPARQAARRALAGRLLAIQGYLHSHHGDAIDLSARPPDAQGRVALELKARPAPQQPIRRVVRALGRQRRALGAAPLTRFLDIGMPGDGNHCGGTFPMRHRPGPLETDCLGQLPGLPGVHLVDSSVLPSLPATTFTYTVMANADRIARQVARVQR